MRWGLSISLSEELADPSVIADVSIAAEANGWDGIFVWDHLWNHTRQPFADPWITLAAVAVATDRMMVGTMVTPLPRHRVQLVAQATTTLDRLSGGRVVLALGLGVDSYGEYSLFDEAAADDKARGAALDAGIEVLVPMLEGGPVPQLGGRVTTAAGARVPRVPIWIAGVSRYTAGPRRVARHDLDGLALVGDEHWSPATVESALLAGGLAPGSLDVALVGGTHPDPVALEGAGATWCIPEVLPGATASDALIRAARRP